MLKPIIALLFGLASLNGAMTVTIQESGADVVMSFSGSINTTDLDAGSSDTSQGLVEPVVGVLVVGPATSTAVQEYDAKASFPITGPTSFGTGAIGFADSGSGDIFGILSNGGFLLPSVYGSGTSLSGGSTYSGSLNDLGLTAGTYNWSWGSGGGADSVTLTIVPEPGTYAAFFGLAALGFIIFRRRN
ncbi:PEP-CTERM sorting domain-containing protein [Rubellicoccus peritrichatus]|uniref:PEP-CTERM sorting domain-containing protein n=1 Tax=Rubellicoccus peritrichatus TaxID=3080537 RepID=A0AAQ3LA58_9BACT|nr:PEP-CTERM sorting domain-containing protein [Puniceicoccus sp. CR14]WOO42479.1 PEP-CTERM sorting domain-containing protein [Puniceicoccus sp. CR14]